MSLPLATKEISNSPGKNAVTSPTDKAVMQADIDRKMRFYGVIQAFRENRYPDNVQIDETLLYVLDNSPIDESKLSSEGRKLISDARDIIETARLIVKEKNSDELFQNFLAHTTRNDASLPNADTTVVDVSKDDVKADGQQAIEHLRTLMRLILTNAEARKLLSDASLIGRDLFARGAVKAAESARPSPEQLARVDDAAPAEQWVGPNGTTHGPNESAPDVLTDEQADQARGAINTARQAQGAKSELQGHATDIASQTYNTEGSLSDKAAFAQRSASQRIPDEHQERAANVAGGVQDEAAQFRSEIDEAPEDEKTDAAKKGLKARMFGLKEKIPQEHRDRAGDQVEKGKQFLKDEFPEERRDQYIYRLKKVLVDCQKHQDYQTALTWFLDAIETYFAHGRTLASHHANKASDVTEDPSLQRATSELRLLLERFANGASMDGMIQAMQALSDDAQEDEGLRDWFKDLDRYIRKTLLEPGFVLSPQFDNDANRLRDTGHQFFDEKYRAHKDNLFDQIQAWFTAFGEDPLNKRFGEDWQRLVKDLLFADDGSLSFKPHLWKDVRSVIIPELVKHVGYIPIPRIEYTDNQMDLVIENLTMEGQNLLPNIISLDAHNFIEFSPYSSITDHDAHDFTFTFSQMQADMRDVAFYFNKKSGLPKIRDGGLADVFLGGEGLTVKVHLTGAGKDKTSVFKVKDVQVKLDSLKFSVRDTKHDLLYKTLKPLATGLVKKQISKAIQDAVRTGLEYLDGELVAVRDRYSEARADPETSTTGALGKIFERKSAEVQSKTESVKSKTGTFKVVNNKRDSVLANEYPGHDTHGWMNRLENRDKAVASGEGWKSKAFDIVPTASGHGGMGVPATTTGASGVTPSHK
ncbi:hypothetical protein DL93DRAFT_2122133 [Clavulina sp. PMI_390]|nr:hypothetical protein DL93DRAFT_2122133 [Clavulina sp. PMI_390]